MGGDTRPQQAHVLKKDESPLLLLKPAIEAASYSLFNVWLGLSFAESICATLACTCLA